MRLKLLKTERLRTDWRFFFLTGLIIVLIIYIPLIILGGNVLLTIHDQLDGEVLSYVLTARHFFDNSIPELFDGVLKTAVTPPAPLMVLPYLFFPARVAFQVNYLLVALIAYAGMFFCIKEILNTRWIALCISVIFSILPFYSVYGLSVMGQPMLLYSFILLWKGNKYRKSFGIIALFGFCSSLVLVGYADLLIILVCILSLSIRNRKINMRMVAGFLELLFIYIIMNISLLKEMLIGDQGFVSHKSELVAASEPVREAFSNMLFHGQYHALPLQLIIVFAVVITFFVVISNFKYLGKKDQCYIYQFTILLAYAIFVALFYALWKFKPIVDIRNELGGLFTSFQVDRFYWTYPAVWYILMGYVLYFVSVLWNEKRLFVAGRIVQFFLVFSVALNVWNNSNIKINWNKLLDQNYSKSGYLTWNDFYASDLFDDIKSYIGKETDTYKVGSAGLYPSIALYNGLYCIDGYSNNYSLEYKHEFRKIIENELNKNESLKAYFDDWGNRCYLFSSEIPFQYYFTKDSQVVIRDWDINVIQLKTMGCNYIFSSIEIDNPDLVLEKKFETPYNSFEVYLYSVAGA